MFAGCGDSETTVTVSQTVSGETIPEETVSETAGPQGDLTSSGIGEVVQGTTEDEAVAAFGEPDSRNEVPGCELDSNAGPISQLTYELDDGTLSINFDAESGELQSYRTDSSSLQTIAGDAVGGSYEDLSHNWGERLQPLALGVEPTAEQGFWFVEDDPEKRLVFDIQKSQIASIWRQRGRLRVGPARRPVGIPSRPDQAHA